MDLQEFITHVRFIFSKAPERLRIFELVNGRRNTSDIARMCGRHANSVWRDLQLLSNGALSQPRVAKGGGPLKVDGFPVYEKVALARTVPTRYFRGPSNLLAVHSKVPRAAPSGRKSAKARRPTPLPLRNENELLDLCRQVEDQTCEFKGQGTDAARIACDIAGMLNTRQGGLILYGVDDNGTIQGSDKSRQKLDQEVQNSVRNTIAPATAVRLHTVNALGHDVVVIVVPPWNRKVV